MFFSARVVVEEMEANLEMCDKIIVLVSARLLKRWVLNQEIRLDHVCQCQVVEEMEANLEIQVCQCQVAEEMGRQITISSALEKRSIIYTIRARMKYWIDRNQDASVNGRKEAKKENEQALMWIRIGWLMIKEREMLEFQMADLLQM